MNERERPTEQTAAETALKAAVDPAYHALVNRLSNCAGAAMAAGEDRVLRIVGVQLAQHGLGDLFEAIFAAVIDGTRPGDGRRFLQAQLGYDGDGSAQWLGV